METNASMISHAGLDWSAARAHFRSVDPVLHALADSMPDPEPSPGRPVFESLARAILGQQLSVKAAATIWGRFADHHRGVPTANGVLETAQDVHRSLGVSGQKHGYLRSLAEHCLDTPSSFESVNGRTDEEIICLLYTSPSPRDVEESRMPSSA